MLFYCVTEDRETGETNRFVCVASGIPQLEGFFNDSITKLVEFSTDVEGAVLYHYDGLALLASV